jgi:hypothetical protein
MRLWMQAMTFADTRIEKGQAEYTKPAKKICDNLAKSASKILSYFTVKPVKSVAKNIFPIFPILTF